MNAENTDRIVNIIGWILDKIDNFKQKRMEEKRK